MQDSRDFTCYQYLSTEETEVLDNRSDGVGNCGHELEEDVQSTAYNVLTGITDRVARNSSLMRRRTLAVALEHALLDVLLCVVENTAGVTHEDSSRDSNDSSTYEDTAYELNAEDKAAYDRNEESED